MVNGYNLNNISPRQVPYMRRTLGIIFQDFRLIEKKTVYENLSFAMRAVGASSREVKRRIPYVLRLVGLDQKEDRNTRSSVGEQQRVAIARALVNNPSMIIADEPTGNLDPQRSLEIMVLLEKINELEPLSWWSPTRKTWSTALTSGWWPSKTVGSSATEQAGITMARKFDAGYYFSEGFHSIFTHGFMSFAAVCMIVACLLIMGSFTLLAVNLDNMLGDMEQENELAVYIDDSYTEESARALEPALLQVPNVTEVTFMTRAEALENFRQDRGNVEILEDLPDDVFRDRYYVRIGDMSRWPRPKRTWNK